VVEVLAMRLIREPQPTAMEIGSINKMEEVLQRCGSVQGGNLRVVLTLSPPAFQPHGATVFTAALVSWALPAAVHVLATVFLLTLE